MDDKDTNLVSETNDAHEVYVLKYIPWRIIKMNSRIYGLISAKTNGAHRVT